jgi:hypothetical protein
VECNEQERLNRIWSDTLGALMLANKTVSQSDTLSRDEHREAVARAARLVNNVRDARTAYYEHRTQHGC